MYPVGLWSISLGGAFKETLDHGPSTIGNPHGPSTINDRGAVLGRCRDWCLGVCQTWRGREDANENKWGKNWGRSLNSHDEKNVSVSSIIPSPSAHGKTLCSVQCTTFPPPCAIHTWSLICALPSCQAPFWRWCVQWKPPNHMGPYSKPCSTSIKASMFIPFSLLNLRRNWATKRAPDLNPGGSFFRPRHLERSWTILGTGSPISGFIPIRIPSDNHGFS